MKQSSHLIRKETYTFTIEELEEILRHNVIGVSPKDAMFFWLDRLSAAPNTQIVEVKIERVETDET